MSSRAVLAILFGGGQGGGRLGMHCTVLHQLQSLVRLVFPWVLERAVGVHCPTHRIPMFAIDIMKHGQCAKIYAVWSNSFAL